MKVLDTSGIDDDKPARNHQMDLFRIVFSVFVLLAHAFELTDGNRSREPWGRLTHTAMSFGEVGVDGFFLLSGFLIVRSWISEPKFLNFIYKRLLRIIPGYSVAVAASILVIGVVAPGIPHYFHSLDRHLVTSILQLSAPRTPPAFPGLPIHSVNNSLWTISYEVRCYLLVAVLGYLGILKQPKIWSIATTLCVFLMSCHALGYMSGRSFSSSLWSGSGMRLLTTFLVGGCFFFWREKLRFRMSLAVAVLCTGIPIVIYIPKLIEPMLIVCGGYLIFYISQLRIRTLDHMNGFPDISYGIYLYGWPIEALWIWHFRGSPWITFVCSTLICFILGWLSWNFIERPALLLKRRIPLSRSSENAWTNRKENHSGREGPDTHGWNAKTEPTDQ